MKRKHTLLLLAVAACLALAGCTSAIPEGGQDLGEQLPNNGNTSDGEWCDPSDSMRWVNPQTGELVSLTIQGTETYEGREVCVGSFEAENSNSEVVRTEYMFSKDEEFTRIVTYDAQGNVVNEFQSSGMGSGDGTTGAQSWCPSGQTIQTSSPQTGERVSFEYEGIVTEDGREVCKAVYTAESTNREIVRTEYFFNQNGTYAKYVSYDAEGNVVDEVKTSSTPAEQGAPSWCPTGESFQYSQQSGQQVSLVYEGIVTEDGRELCKAVFTQVPSSLQERSEEQVVRAEYFVNQDETYVKIVTYDADGNVVNEQVIDDS